MDREHLHSGFHLEFNSIEAFAAFVALWLGQDNPIELQARIDALAARQKAANTKLETDVAATTPS